MAATWENVQQVRDAQASAAKRFAASQVATNEQIQQVLQDSEKLSVALPRMTELEALIFRLRSELIDYIIEHGLVQGFIFDGVNQPIQEGNVVITAEMILSVMNKLGYNNLQQNDAKQDEEIEALQEADKSFREEQQKQDERLDAIETEQETQNSRLDAIEANNTEQDGRLDAIEEEQTTQNQRIETLEGTADDLGNRLGEAEDKLSGIEENAERNRVIDVVFNSLSVLDPETRVATITITPEDIKKWYESNPNTNAFTDADKLKLDSMYIHARVSDVLVNGDSVLDEDRRAIITKEIIKDAYEANPDTNAFTDADKNMLQDVNKRIGEAEPKIEDHGERIEALETNDTKQDDEIESLQTEVGSLDSRVESLEDSDTTQDGKISALESSQATQNADISSLKTNDTKQDDEIESLQTEVGSLDSRVESLEDSDTTQDGKISALESSQATQNNDISNLKSSQSEQDTKINKINSDAYFKRETIADCNLGVLPGMYHVDGTTGGIKNAPAGWDSNFGYLNVGMSQDGRIAQMLVSAKSVDDAATHIAWRVRGWDGSWTAWHMIVPEALNSDVSSLKTSQATQDGKISALESSQATQNTDISNLKSSQSTQDNSIKALQTSDTTQNTRLTNLETGQNTQNTNIKANTDKNTAQDTSINSLNTKMNNLSTKSIKKGAVDSAPDGNHIYAMSDYYEGYTVNDECFCVHYNPVNHTWEHMGNFQVSITLDFVFAVFTNKIAACSFTVWTRDDTTHSKGYGRVMGFIEYTDATHFRFNIYTPCCLQHYDGHLYILSLWEAGDQNKLIVPIQSNDHFVRLVPDIS